MAFNVIDLFSGVGGLSLGFQQAGFQVVLANEYDKQIAGAYRHNHPKTTLLDQDITAIPIHETFSDYHGHVDAVIGGPPCQGFSQKGKRKTIHDERNFLFKYFVDVVRAVSPKYFLMENVPNLLTSHNGYFRKELEELFAEANYSITASVLNAADFGVPQSRRRAFILGKRSNTPIALPEKSKSKTTIWQAISDLAYLESGQGEEVSQYTTTSESDYQTKMRNNSNLLFNHRSTNHSRIALERMSLIPVNGDRSYLPAEHLTKSIHSGTWARMISDQQSVTITTRFDTPASGRFTHPILNRAITVREAARLQSFPDTFQFLGTKTSQMKQVGNAVPPMLARKIAETILDDLERTDE